VSRNQNGFPSYFRVSKKGSASALIILVLTALTLLGVLALVTAASDFRLSQKRAAWQKDYFAVDSEAVGFQSALDIQLKQLLLKHQNISGSELAESAALEIHKWLEQQPVQNASVIAGTNSLSVAATIALNLPPEPSDQMIDLQFEISTNRDEPDFGLLKIKKWSQWQTRPAAQEEGGIIWLP
jgi:hypothetical protein